MSWMIVNGYYDEFLPLPNFFKTRFGECEVTGSYIGKTIHVKYRFSSPPENIDDFVKTLKDYLKDNPYKIEEIVEEQVIKKKSLVPEGKKYRILSKTSSRTIVVSFKFSEERKDYMKSFLREFEEFLKLQEIDEMLSHLNVFSNGF